MSVVRVAIPLLKGKRKFFLEKGRSWSLPEHVFLAALVKKPRTVEELAEDGDVPRRLVLEALIRLMRAGWVTLQQEGRGVIFSATEMGHVVVDQDELPRLAKATSRWMNFVIDEVTGTLYRSREMPFFERHIVESRATRERLVWLKTRNLDAFDDTAAVLANLFEDDERFLGIEPSAEKMVRRFAIATVRDNNVEGLPPRAPSWLSDLVKVAAGTAGPSPMALRSPHFDSDSHFPQRERSVASSMDATFKMEDLLLGGDAHQKVFRELIRKVKRRLIIHSTFVSEDGFSQVQDELISAAKRGAIIDILWGEDENKTDSVTTAKTIAIIRRHIEAMGLASSIRISPFSTRSHAKIVVYDDGRTENLSTIVGSCNWLSTGFKNYEASVGFSDPVVVSAVLEQIADLTRGGDRHWTDLTSEMARLASDARIRKQASSPNAKVTLVLGPQHAHFARVARDNARHRIFVTSHKIGAAARPSVLVPALAAVRENGVEARMFYGLEGPSEISNELFIAENVGLLPSPVLSPRLHAKVLAWDDDHALITSQNWLSADPGESNVRREIGLMVESAGVARKLIDHFDAARGSDEIIETGGRS